VRSAGGVTPELGSGKTIIDFDKKIRKKWLKADLRTGQRQYKSSNGSSGESAGKGGVVDELSYAKGERELNH